MTSALRGVRLPEGPRLGPAHAPPNPLVLHDIGRGTLEEDVLFTFPITGRYRYLPEPLARVCGEDSAAADQPGH
ncbi:MAG: DUF1287 domain-containing protein [Thermoanaerobaculia bacterium]|nr:DUF1287 domain-containing protein [Thermoanaerobaculia bacterium]